jgi:conjugal transfer pilus assembly protein TraE
MDLDLAHGSAQRVLRQRNALALAALVLGGLLVTTYIAATHQNREVILVPTLRSAMTLSTASVSPDYLEMVTRDVSAVALNRSPDALPYWMNSILAVTDERARGVVKAQLIRIVAEQQGSQITQFFTPDMLQVNPAKLESEVGGTVHTVVSMKEISTVHRTFKFEWSYNGVSLKLMGFGQIEQAGTKP